MATPVTLPSGSLQPTQQGRAGVAVALRVPGRGGFPMGAFIISSFYVFGLFSLSPASPQFL